MMDRKLHCVLPIDQYGIPRQNLALIVLLLVLFGTKIQAHARSVQLARFGMRP